MDAKSHEIIFLNIFGHSIYMETFLNASVETRVQLSSTGLNNLRMELYGGSFEFIVGNVPYQCSPIVAEFLSPKISRIRQSDPTVCQYVLETSDESVKFKDFLALAFESELQVQPENFSFFIAIAHELENKELLSQLASAFLDTTEVTVSNVVPIFWMKKLISGGDEEIAFIASHFNEIDNLELLDVHSLRRVLSHPSLRLESEDSLYNFISGLIEKDQSFTELLELVVFEFLSAESIQRFVKASHSFIFESLNPPIWNCICARLSHDVIIKSSSSAKQEERFGRQIITDEAEKLSAELQRCEKQLAELHKNYDSLEERYRESERGRTELHENYGSLEEQYIESERGRTELHMNHAALQKNMETMAAERNRIEGILYDQHFPLNPSKPLNGIIAYLTRECGGNVHDKGIVKITTRREDDRDILCPAAKNIADLEANSYFDCTNSGNMWVCYDFKEKAIILEAYSLRSGYNIDTHNLKTWEIDVSMNGSSWVTVDRQSNNDLNGRNRIASYRLSNPIQCRFVRLKQTGRNHADSYDTYTSSFEVFGRLAADKMNCTDRDSDIDNHSMSDIDNDLMSDIDNDLMIDDDLKALLDELDE